MVESEFGLNYAAVHFKITRWRWYKVENMAHVFIFIILHCKRHDGFVGEIELKRGQALLSVKAIVEGTGVSTKKVRTILSRLKKSEELSLKTTNKFSIITVCNYDKYQALPTTVGQTKGKQRANKGQHTKEYKEIKENNKGTNGKFNPFDIRPDWFPKKRYGDLLLHRKSLKAVQSETAIRAILKQFRLAMQKGWSVDDLVDEMTNRSWKGLKADWLKPKKQDDGWI